ncbi:MAG TPA: hypothetical protein VFH78_10430 [Candidatus Thermoplasmatota archaeon]|nr:hypothetical protein [Candidatus Thermoplasmatota archaeon]
MTASFAFLPSADAAYTCDPVTTRLCALTYSYGTCDNGSAANMIYYWQYDSSGYTWVSAMTSCGGYPGYYDYSAVGASATVCDASWSCTAASVSWYGVSWPGYSYCDTSVFAYAGGQYHSVSGGCPAGAPPDVPALLP